MIRRATASDVPALLPLIASYWSFEGIHGFDAERIERPLLRLLSDPRIAYFVSALRFRVVEDTRLDETKRWVVVAPQDSRGAALLLAKAANAEQQARVGDQTGGRVGLFLETDDFWGDYRHMKSSGVEFVGEPREEPYGTVVVFRDLYGNKWDLIGRRPASSPA